MFSLFFRGMIVYIIMIFTMRALGKRQLGQFQPYEFAMAILLADVISAPMESVSTPLLHGLLGGGQRPLQPFVGRAGQPRRQRQRLNALQNAVLQDQFVSGYRFAHHSTSRGKKSLLVL